jgi:integrase
MHGRHLTRAGKNWVFQIRVPVQFKHLQLPSPIRLNLGRLEKRAAQTAARELAVSARRALQKALLIMTEHKNDQTRIDSEAIRQSVYADLDADLRYILPLFRAIGDGGGSAETSQSVTDEARSVSAGLITMDILRSAGRHPATVANTVDDDDGSPKLAGFPFSRLEKLQQNKSQKLSLEEMVFRIAATVERLEANWLHAGAPRPVEEPAKPKSQAILFSAAADSYHDLLKATHGAGYTELNYIRQRKDVFLQICKDKPVDEYSQEDLQHFANRVSRLPPNHSKLPNLKRLTINQIIDKNEAAGGKGIARKTLVNNYLGRIKTIIRHGCLKSKVKYDLDHVRVIIPRHVSKPPAKLLQSHSDMNAIFKCGVASGLLSDAMLPLLGFLTGRRLGLLASLRGEMIVQHGGYWVVFPASHAQVDGKMKELQIKTDESMSVFVLHNFLAEIGFVEWAQQRRGFVFEALHETQDPADTGSKRMGRLFKAAGLNPKTHKKFHGLRHLKIDESRANGISNRSTRLQVGHELIDIHDGYGSTQLRPDEMAVFADAPLPKDIDWSVFYNLDFDALATARPTHAPKPRTKRKFTHVRRR